MIFLGVLACAGSTPPRVEATPGGLVVDVAELVEIEIRNPDGAPVLSERWPRPVDHAEVRHAWRRPGAYEVVLRTTERTEVTHVDVPPLAAALVEIEAPLGADPIVPKNEEELVVTLPGGGGEQAQMIVAVTALRPGPAAVSHDGQRIIDKALGSLERAAVLVPLGGEIEVRTNEGRVAFHVSASARTAEEIARTVEVGDIHFPSDRLGRPEVGRPAGRVSLPSAWWTSVLERFGLGARSRDPYAPWSHLSVPITNDGDQALSVVVESRVLDRMSGEVDAAFRAPAIGGTSAIDASRVLLRVPPHDEAIASIPLYVDDRALISAPRRERAIEVRLLSLGGDTPMVVENVPLVVRTGNPVASLGLVGAIVAGLLGTGLLVLRLGTWLKTLPSNELMTIALFSTLTFAVQATGSAVGLLLSAVLGPFSPIVVGGFDAVFRYSLVATLLTLVPRPGVAALAILTEWILGAVLLGNLAASDLMFVGDRVFFHEALLFLFGITRHTGWRDESHSRRWLRLFLAFGFASLLTSAVGLVLHVTLYRLFFASWYVALLLIGPGFLYVGLAIRVAVPFAESLRRVAR